MGYEHNVDFINLSRGILTSDYMFQLIWGRKAILYLPAGRMGGYDRWDRFDDVADAGADWTPFDGDDGGFWGGIEQTGVVDAEIDAFLDSVQPLPPPVVGDELEAAVAAAEARLARHEGRGTLEASLNRWRLHADDVGLEMAPPRVHAPRSPDAPVIAGGPIGHFVFWNGHEILDPGCSQPYSHEGVDFEYMLLFNHMPQRLESRDGEDTGTTGASVS